MGLDQNLMLFKKQDAEKILDIQNRLDEGNVKPKQVEKEYAPVKPVAKEYFRKFNALHNYVDQNCNVDGLELNLRYVKVDTAQLINDISTNEQAAESLTPVEGFFFGSTEQDDWFWEDVSQLKEYLSKINSEYNLDDHTLLYSCWY